MSASSSLLDQVRELFTDALHRHGKRRIALTLFSLIVFSFASYVPLPGLNLQNAFLADGDALERMSIAALGVFPWLTAVAAIETLGTFFPAVARSSAFSGPHVDIYGPWTIILTLVIALTQAYGVMVGLEGGIDLTDMRFGDLSRLTMVATLTAGALVPTLLAGLIDTKGVGQGFWLIMGFAFLTQLPGNFYAIAEVARGMNQPFLPYLSLDFALLLLVIVLATFMVLSHGKEGVHNPGYVVWPLLVSGQIAFWSISALEFFEFDFITRPGVMSPLAYQIHFDLVMIVSLLPVLWLSLRRDGLDNIRLLPLYILLPVFIALPTILEWQNPLPYTPWYSAYSLATYLGLFMAFGFLVTRGSDAANKQA